MFSFIDSVIKLIVGIPIMIFFVYVFGAFGHSFFGGPMWLWMVGIVILGILAIVEELNKSKSKESQID